MDDNFIKQQPEDKRFSQAVEYAFDYIIMTDTEGIVLYANPAFHRITGFTKEEVIGKKAGTSKSWGGQMGADFYKKLWQTIKTEKKPFHGEIINKRKNGQKYWAQTSISPVLNDSGEVEFFVAIERDITKEKNLENLKDEFLSIASHELRTPLTAIDGLISMILDGEYGPINDNLKLPLKDVGSSSEQLIRLVNDLLSLSRMQANRMKYELVTLSVKDVITEIINVLKPLAIEKNITLKLIDRADINIQTDKDKSRQILENLVGNSLKFTQKGEITLSWQPVGETVEISITDTGIGISKEDQSKLFGRFEQLGSVGKSTGTGLGLYIARSLARRLGGDVWLKDSAVGRGTVFIFSSPIAGTRLAQNSKKLLDDNVSSSGI